MAVTTNSLTQPQGELEPSVFSEADDFNAYLSGWLEAAPDDLSDEATAAYVYMRAFEWQAESLAARPAREDVDDAASLQHTDQQREHWQRKAAYWRSRYEEADEDEDTGTPPVRSQSVSSSVSWV